MTSTKNKSVPWVELYRPKNLDEVAHQEDVVATLKSTVKTGQLPHLLLVRKSHRCAQAGCTGFVSFLISHHIFPSCFLCRNAARPSRLW